MAVRKIGRLTLAVTLFTILFGGMSSSQAAPARGTIPFASPTFQQVWARTDQLIATGKVQRGYFWGSLPNTPGIMEDFADAPGGKRLVQYFDKSRMEINDPNADKSSKFYVTNGLLATELLTGKMQIGNNSFVDLGAPNIPLASDPDDATAPTYASFGATINYGIRALVGDLVNRPLNIDEQNNKALLTHYDSFNVRYTLAEGGFIIPDVFWNYVNASGLVLVNGKQITAHLSDPWFYATGYPITDAYWARVKIAGKPNTDVLIQAYERRILTYVPSAPDGYKVQMSNIGQHYYQWRYGNDPAHPVDFLTRCGGGLSGVGDSFAHLWANYPDLHFKLLCPIIYNNNTGHNSNTNGPTVQSFEHGQMVSLVFNQHSDTPIKYIYVLYDDGSAQRFDDTFVDGTPEPPANPPAGLYIPKYGIGKLWRENSVVSSKLGWATNHERRYYTSEYIFTAHGLLLANALDLTKVTALYGNADLEYTAWQRVDVGVPPAETNCSPDANFASNAFGHLWNISPTFQQQLGCPYSPTDNSAPKIQLTVQQFQHGEMVYVIWDNPSGDLLVPSTEAYGLRNDGSIISSISDYEPVPPPDPGNPPAGLYALGDKFSDFWRTHALVQQEFGWATAPQQDISATDCYAFVKGIMWRANGEIRYMFAVEPPFFLYSELWGSWAE